MTRLTMSVSLTKRVANLKLVDEFGLTSLHKACLNNDIAKVTHILNAIDVDSKSTFINRRDRKHRTALLFACEKGSTEIAVKLLQHGADISITEEYELSCLHEACFNNHVDVVTALLDHLNLKHALLDHLNLKHASLHFVNRTDDYDRTPLFLACMMGHDAVVIRLLQNQADVTLHDKDGQTCLHVACHYNRIQVVKTLLGYIGETLRFDFINKQDSKGRSALTIACGEGHCEIVELLMKLGVDVTVANEEGSTCLHVASVSNSVEAVKMLLETVAEEGKTEFLNTKDKRGRTALFCACESGNGDVVTLLIKHGAKNP